MFQMSPLLITPSPPLIHLWLGAMHCAMSYRPLYHHRTTVYQCRVTAPQSQSQGYSDGFGRNRDRGVASIGNAEQLIDSSAARQVISYQNSRHAGLLSRSIYHPASLAVDRNELADDMCPRGVSSPARVSESGSTASSCTVFWRYTSSPCYQLCTKRQAHLKWRR